MAVWRQKWGPAGVWEGGAAREWMTEDLWERGSGVAAREGERKRERASERKSCGRARDGALQHV